MTRIVFHQPNFSSPKTVEGENRLKLSVKEDKDEKESESKIEYGTKNYSERSWGEQIIDVVSPKLVKDSVKNHS